MVINLILKFYVYKGKLFESSLNYNIWRRNMKITSQIIGILIIIGIFTNSISQIIAINNTEPVIETSDDETANIQKSIGFNIEERIELSPNESAHLTLNEIKHEFFPIFENTFENSQAGPLAQNIILKGFITDNSTGLPLQNANIFNYEAYYMRFNYSIVSVNSDPNGYYELNILNYYNIYYNTIIVRANSYFTELEYLNNLNEGENWLNFSLNPNRPVENSSVNIELYDNLTHECIENAIVIMYKIDEDEYVIKDWNYTCHYSNCLYSLNCNSGNIYFLIFARNYFYLDTNLYQINNSENKTIKLYLNPIPPETSKIFGSIKDYKSGKPIDKAIITVSWWDFFYSNYYWNYTFSNESGFYSFNIAPGEIRIYVSAEGYFDDSYSYFDVNENEIRQIDFYLHPIPEENAVIYGLITDNETGKSIGNAQIELTWRDAHYNYMSNETYSNSFGFYSISVAEGKVSLDVTADGYFRESTSYYNVNQYETIRIDVYLNTPPEENSIILGFIKDIENEDPISNAEISITWKDGLGHYYSNYTHSDSNGFYTMNVAEGTIRLFANKQGYFSNNTDYFYLGENDAININIYLAPRPEENSIIFGYVKDFLTNESIENTEVRYYWINSHYISNRTFSDGSGFYMMNVPAGTFSLSARKSGYYDEDSDDLMIDEYEALSVDIYLHPEANENSVVYGYITDFLTGEPIFNASLSLDWEDEYGHSDWNRNRTYTDPNGFYRFNVPAGLIDLYVSQGSYYSNQTNQYSINEFEDLRIDVTLYPKPSENSIISGYIIDNKDKYPVTNGEIWLNWEDDFGHYLYNYTYSNENGYYEMNVPSGWFDLRIYADGYFSGHTEDFLINENETLWINISLYPKPKDSATIYGYIENNITNVRIINASISLHWKDSFGHSKYNHTNSDENGYYEINVPEGELYLDLSANGYFSGHTDSYVINENEKRWINVSLYPEPSDNALIKGHITDEKTNVPVSNAEIRLHWKDNFGHGKYNYTNSDENGYYEINVAEGELYLSIYADGYFSESTEDYKIKENKKLLINIILTPKPPENALIKGFLTDKNTDNKASNVEIRLRWEDDFGHYLYNYSYSNENGYYEINVAEGEFDLSIHTDGYFSEYTNHYVIKEKEQLWINISLYSIPKDCAVIQGYVIDKKTNMPIVDANIEPAWRDGLNRYHSYNHTESDQNGYYKMSIPCGKLKIYFGAYEYDSKNKDIQIKENEIKWLNVSLKEYQISVNIEKPRRAIYINNQRYLFSLIPIVVGDIKIKVYESLFVEYVDFYIDGVFKYRDDDYQIEFLYNDKCYLNHLHTIEVIGYSKTGSTTKDKITILKYY